MIEEFNKYKEYSSKINIEDKNCNYTWKKLFQGGIDLFEGYKYFLQINILAKSDFKSWDGLVEIHLRKLVVNFFDMPQIKLRPFSVAYDVKDDVYPYSRTYFFGISLVDPETLAIKPNKVINLREPIKKFISDLDKKRDKKEDKNMRISLKDLKDLPFEVKRK